MCFFLNKNDILDVDIWTIFQKHNEIPKIVITILNATGFNSAISVKTLNEKWIVEIEKCLSSYLRHSLKDSVYSRMKTIKLLPGHKSIILGLPTRLTHFEQCQKSEINIKKMRNIDDILKKFKILLHIFICYVENLAMKYSVVTCHCHKQIRFVSLFLGLFYISLDILF